MSAPEKEKDMTVYVVQSQQRFDHKIKKLVPKYPDLEKTASKFGKVVYLLSPSAAPWNSEAIVKELEEKLKNFGNDDHLLCIGNPVLIALSAMVAWKLSEDGNVNFLQWSGKEKSYLTVNTSIEDGS